MAAQLILTIVARDRPGLVQRMSELVAAHSGNWMDSSMARLGGEFAGIVRVEIPNDHVAALKSALVGIKDDGIAVTMQDARTAEQSSGTLVKLTVTGLDHPGIVRDISAALAQNGVNIEEMQTDLFPGSMTGEQMFSASAQVVMPDGVGTDALNDALERLAQDMMVDIQVVKVVGD